MNKQEAGNNGTGRVTKPAVVAQAPANRTVVGIRLDPRILQQAVNVLKSQPWEDVADFMPAMIQAQPLFEDELAEPPTQE